MKKSINPIRKRNVRRRASKKFITTSTLEKSPTYWEFAERVNGRTAMQGFVWGSVNQAITGNNILEQLVTQTNDGYNLIAEDVLNVVLVIGAITLGSAITTFAPNKDLEYTKILERFTTDAEIINGRLAMCGFVALVFFT